MKVRVSSKCVTIVSEGGQELDEKMTPKAKAARNEYMRKYYREHKEERKDYNRRYWERKAKEKDQEKQNGS